MVAIVYVGDTNVNEAMLKAGEVWASRKYLRKRQDAAWCAYENTARQSKIGLWAQATNDWIDHQPRPFPHFGHRRSDLNNAELMASKTAHA